MKVMEKFTDQATEARISNQRQINAALVQFSEAISSQSPPETRRQILDRLARLRAERDRLMRY